MNRTTKPRRTEKESQSKRFVPFPPPLAIGLAIGCAGGLIIGAIVGKTPPEPLLRQPAQEYTVPSIALPQTEELYGQVLSNEQGILTVRDRSEEIRSLSAMPTTQVIYQKPNESGMLPLFTEEVGSIESIAPEMYIFAKVESGQSAMSSASVISITYSEKNPFSGK